MNELEDLVEAVWQRQRPRVLGRLEVVVGALRAGVADQEAAREAHVLAGALGTYGRPGSSLLRRAELALTSGDVPSGLSAEVLALVEQGALDRHQQAPGDEQQQGDAQR